MLARIRKSMEEKDQGFTLIELLVVMIIIGVLAAIAVPVFLSQRVKARETAAVADASNIVKEVATYYVDGTATPTLAATGGVWTLTGGATGKLSGSDVLVGTPVMTDATHYCFLIGTSTTGDKVALATSTGVTKVASTTTTCTAA